MLVLRKKGVYMKKFICLLLICLMTLFFCSCKPSKPSWQEKVDMIEKDMPCWELFALMGGEGTDLHTNEPYLMYILSEEHILVVCLTKGRVDNKVVDVVAVEPVVVTYEEFKEWFGYYPDDAEAPWNDPEVPWN